LPATSVVRKPENVSLEKAAGFGVDGLESWMYYCLSFSTVLQTIYNYLYFCICIPDTSRTF
jgi:hypothetical protein